MSCGVGVSCCYGLQFSSPSTLIGPKFNNIPDVMRSSCLYLLRRNQILRSKESFRRGARDAPLISVSSAPDPSLSSWSLESEGRSSPSLEPVIEDGSARQPQGETPILANTTDFSGSLPGNHILLLSFAPVKVQFQIFFDPVLAETPIFKLKILKVREMDKF